MSKEILLKVLNELKSDREPASGFIFLIENDSFSDEMVDKLGEVLQDAIVSTKDSSLKNKFLEAKQKIEEIQRQESESNKQEEKELLEMENTLLNIEN